MSTALTFPLITAAQYFELPDPTGGYIYELHFGELVKVGRPKKGHYDLQRRIREVLVRSLTAQRWTVDIQMPYGVIPTYDVRAADVGAVRRKVWDAIPDEGYLIGSPDLIVQIQSPSNRDRKMEEDAIMHITHGSTAVWLVNPVRQEVIGITAASRTVYQRGDRIELPAPLSTSIAVDDIFPE